MIGKRERDLPTEWTDSAIRELLDHANELASNGNPAGFFVGNGLLRVNRSFPFTPDEFAACRAWIEENSDLVQTAWNYEVRYGI